MRVPVTISIKNIKRIRSKLNTLADNMKEVSKTKCGIYGGKRKKIFKKEKNQLSGSDIIRIQAAQGKYFFGMSYDNEIKRKAFQKLHKKLSAIINDRTYDKTFKLTIKDFFLEAGEWYIKKYVEYIEKYGTGWQNGITWQETKKRIQAAKMLPILGISGLSGVFTGRTLKSLKARIEKTFIRS